MVWVFEFTSNERNLEKIFTRVIRYLKKDNIIYRALICLNVFFSAALTSKTVISNWLRDTILFINFGVL